MYNIYKYIVCVFFTRMQHQQVTAVAAQQRERDREREIVRYSHV